MSMNLESTTNMFNPLLFFKINFFVKIGVSAHNKCIHISL